MDEALSSYYASGDYLLSDLAEKEEITQSAQNVINLVITFLTGFLAVIGLSNVWASISGNLRQRRQEFAMLKSVGLSPRQLWVLLLLEGLTLGLKPLLYSLPVQIAVLTAMLTLGNLSAGIPALCALRHFNRVYLPDSSGNRRRLRSRREAAYTGKYYCNDKG